MPKITYSYFSELRGLWYSNVELWIQLLKRIEEGKILGIWFITLSLSSVDFLVEGGVTPKELLVNFFTAKCTIEGLILNLLPIPAIYN